MNKDSSYSSERLTYRGIEECDASYIVKWRSDPANYVNFFQAHPITPREHLNWFKKYLSDESRYDFIIYCEDIPIGTIGLSSIDSTSCETNYMIGDQRYRGNGFATEAVKTFAGIAAAELGIKVIRAKIKPKNIASQKVVIGGGSLKSSVSSRFMFEAIYNLPSAG